MLRSIQVDCSPVYSRYPRNRNGKYGRLGARLCNPRWGIRERIDHVYPSLRPAERAVAQYIRDHIEEAADLTVGQMADIATSASRR